jgi:hypothetical protein
VESAWYQSTCGKAIGFSPELAEVVNLCLRPGELDNIDCDHPYQICAESACDFEYKGFPDVGGDPQFEGRSCTEFSFRGSITADFCYDPGETPDPYEGNELCGDHWMHPVQLTTDWRFFKVPFNTLLQQGWAKESDFLDLTAASLIRFTFDRGWLDTYLDGVRFYRRAGSVNDDDADPE